MADEPVRGACLCGAVMFELIPPLRPVIVCHCRQCSRWTGYAVAATAVELERFKLIAGASELTWFASSDHADRGFCATCGSSMFWKPRDGSRIAVLAGLLDSPTGLQVSAHIHVADKADFYSIGDGVAQYPAGAGELAHPRPTA